ncbi:MAG: hypothetical protein EBV03_08015 [Proteobacteria bacterium]|nr:hypothetical protein [Pseudomonadota bacterium]
MSYLPVKDTLVIMTGGTIDAEAYPDPANPPKDATMLDHSMIPMTVAQMNPKYDQRCDYLVWRAKDSKHFSDKDMMDLAKIIRTSRARNIIITHGTDAMPENSRTIRSLLARPDKDLRVDAGRKEGLLELQEGGYVRGVMPGFDKRVIFTGAMMPLANGPESDAYKNLEYIFANMDGWKNGVRAVMHSKSFDVAGLEKDFTTYQFKGRVLPDGPAKAGRE